MDGTADCFERAMAVNGDGFALGHFEAAYHALVSALHFAQDLRDEDRLGRVARVAGEQRLLVDAASPPHLISTRMAEGRGHESLFRMAQRQAETQVKIMHSANRRAGTTPIP